MKKFYQTTEVSVILFENQDVVRTSGLLVQDDAIVTDRGAWTRATTPTFSGLDD